MSPEMMFAGQGAAADPSLVQLAVYGALGLVFTLVGLTVMAVFTLPLFFAALLVLEGALRLTQGLPDPFGKSAKVFGLVFRSLRRNLVRTALTYVALFVLTGMLTLIYSVVALLTGVTREKENNLQVIMTEKFSVPSLMPPGYAGRLRAIIEQMPADSRPANIDDNFMTWSFVGGSMDPDKRTQENSMFMFCLQPDAVLTMMAEHGLNKDDLGEEGYAALVRGVDLVKQDKRNIIVGEERLKMMNKRVGDDIKLYGLNYKDIVFDFRIVAAFPAGSRHATGAAMRYDYLAAKLDEYKVQKGKDHPQANACVNLIWVRLPNRAAFEQLAAVVNDPGTFSSPAVKLETASAGISSILEGYKEIVWGTKYIIMPAIGAIMCLVVGITITIGVRERWTEMAVLKVLGFQPWQVMAMIISEAVLIGLFGSLLSTWLVTLGPEFIEFLKTTAGVKVQIAFFNQFKAPKEVIVLGPALGVFVGLVGSALPSRNARRVKVSEVFSQVA